MNLKKSEVSIEKKPFPFQSVSEIQNIEIRIDNFEDVFDTLEGAAHSIDKSTAPEMINALTEKLYELFDQEGGKIDTTTLEYGYIKTRIIDNKTDEIEYEDQLNTAKEYDRYINMVAIYAQHADKNECSISSAELKETIIDEIRMTRDAIYLEIAINAVKNPNTIPTQDEVEAKKNKGHLTQVKIQQLIEGLQNAINNGLDKKFTSEMIDAFLTNPSTVEKINTAIETYLPASQNENPPGLEANQHLVNSIQEAINKKLEKDETLAGTVGKLTVSYELDKSAGLNCFVIKDIKNQTIIGKIQVPIHPKNVQPEEGSKVDRTYKYLKPGEQKWIARFVRPDGTVASVSGYPNPILLDGAMDTEQAFEEGIVEVVSGYLMDEAVNGIVTLHTSTKKIT